MDTTADASVCSAGEEAATLALPALVLAHSEGGQRAPEVKVLPRLPVVLGRGAGLFDGGPLNDARISREHARLSPEGGGWYLEDLTSRNGVWLDGARLQGRAPLRDGSVLRLGDTLLVFASCMLVAPPQGELVGVSAALGAVRRSVEAARCPASVLITGETGTGKELVAQALHRRGGRKGRLVSVNCGAVPEGLMASELFGHVRGAFTGAHEAREGLFRQAEGGTLFLDELGEMPLALQVQLLRALESREIQPVGATRPVGVDVWVLAATNQNLQGALQSGAFRPDLYARLAQWQIVLPPLRERRADIPLLVQHLLRRSGAGARPLHVDLAHELLLHPWPFNVRGLLNALTAAGLSSPSPAPLRLTPEVEQLLAIRKIPAAGPVVRGPTSPTPSRAQIEGLLAQASGRVSDVARALGCSRQQLYGWMAEHGIKPANFRRS